MNNIKTAIFLTGSGGTISHEVALIDQLIEQKKLTLNQEYTWLFASGTSAITLVAINACFRKDSPTSWDNYFKSIFLETLSDDEIFLKVHPIQWSTHPMRKKLHQLLKITGFSRISDLPFHSTILTTSVNRGKTTWLKSTSPKHSNGDLTDILMASSAIPVLFPPQVINSVFDLPLEIKEGTYAEGANFGIYNNFRKQLKKLNQEHGTIDELLILSPQRDFSPSHNHQHNFSGMNRKEWEEYEDFLEHISLNGFLEFLMELNDANRKKKYAQTIKVSLPETGRVFNLLDFSNQLLKYKHIKNWVEYNPDRLSMELHQFCEEVSSIQVG
jgi:patatin-like phospholipase/acyl hydrolase